MYALVQSAPMLFADRLQKDRAHVPQDECLRVLNAR